MLNHQLNPKQLAAIREHDKQKAGQAGQGSMKAMGEARIGAPVGAPGPAGAPQPINPLHTAFRPSSGLIQNILRQRQALPGMGLMRT